MEAWAQAWLARQCKMVPGASRAVLVLGAADRGPFSPVAAWPDDAAAPCAELLGAADLAMTERRGVIQTRKPAHDTGAPSCDDIAVPLLAERRLLGAVAIAVPSRAEPQQRAVVHLLKIGASWLDLLIRQQTPPANDRLVAVLELIATALEHERFQSAATALVTELAKRLACERVALGFRRGVHARVEALSHSARFAHQANLISDIGVAMDEALDQAATVLHPPPADGPPRLGRAHAELSRQHGAGSVCSVPFGESGRVFGVLTLERPRGRPFDPPTVELCEQVASLAGPILDLKWKDDRRLAAKAKDSLRAQVEKLTGPKHLTFKAIAAACLAGVAFLSLAGGEHRIKARASVEGTVQRAMVAAFDGYIAEAHARAGDIVKAGDLLAALDGKDLELERVKLASRGDQLAKQYRGALAVHDASQARILRAQMDQAEAELRLLEEQLARTQLVAPFDGIVVKGDLSQLLGSPVERGQVLFELAPLESYRVILEVDEREISRVELGQPGRLGLSAMPGRTLPLRVSKITPVSTAEDGRNYFRVEAQLDDSPGFLRPGMEGIGKIEAGRRKLIWIWAHGVIDWIRLWVWTWSP